MEMSSKIFPLFLCACVFERSRSTQAPCHTHRPTKYTRFPHSDLNLAPNFIQTGTLTFPHMRTSPRQHTLTSPHTCTPHHTHAHLTTHMHTYHTHAHLSTHMHTSPHTCTPHHTHAHLTPRTTHLTTHAHLTPPTDTPHHTHAHLTTHMHTSPHHTHVHLTTHTHTSPHTCTPHPTNTYAHLTTHMHTYHTHAHLTTHMHTSCCVHTSPHTCTPHHTHVHLTTHTHTSPHTRTPHPTNTHAHLTKHAMQMIVEIIKIVILGSICFGSGWNMNIVMFTSRCKKTSTYLNHILANLPKYDPWRATLWDGILLFWEHNFSPGCSFCIGNSLMLGWFWLSTENNQSCTRTTDTKLFPVIENESCS